MSAPVNPGLADTPGVTLRAEGLIALRQVALRARGKPVLADLPGGFVTRRKGHGQEVADVRVYVEGDDLRHLDRGTTARTGVLHVRQFMDERDRVLLLVADFRAPMLWGITRAFRSVAVAEALCLLGWQAVEEGGRVGLLALTGSGPLGVRPRGRVRGMLDVIGGMVTAHEQALAAPGDTALADALEPVERLAPGGSEVVIASGFDRPGALGDALTDMARRRVVRLMMMGDARADRLPRGRYPIRLPDGRRLRVSLTGQAEAEPRREIAGFPLLHLDAGQPVEGLARHLAAAFPQDRAP